MVLQFPTVFGLSSVDFTAEEKSNVIDLMAFHTSSMLLFNTADSVIEVADGGMFTVDEKFAVLLYFDAFLSK